MKEKYYKLSVICNSIQSTLSSKYGSNNYWIQAEISGLKITKGHCYITLIEKENNSANPIASIRGMIWNSDYLAINKKFKNATGFDLKDNIKILFLASVSFHINFGLSLTIKDIEPGFTIGSLLMQREAIVKKLKEENVYNLNKKRNFPIVPQRIAVISASDSKGYEDFLMKIENNIYKYRFSITLFTALLQGDKAAMDIKNKLIEIYQNIEKFDLVIIVRGGGGAVNLNCFNDYVLSKAVAKFPLPVITGIGHTSNISIVDEVAYLDKITPTDVADYIIDQTSKYEEGMQYKFQMLITRYTNLKNNEFHNNTLKIQNLSHSIDNIRRSNFNILANIYSRVFTHSKQLIKEKSKDKSILKQNLNRLVTIAIRVNQKTIGNLSYKIKYISNYKITSEKEGLKVTLKELLSGYKNKSKTEILLNKGRSDKIRYLDPKNILKKGYSITLRNGKSITNSDSLKSTDLITTILFEGEIESIIINKK